MKMMNFKEFVEQQCFVEFIQESFNAPQVAATSGVRKPWSASKKEILDIWGKMRPNLPIYITPMDDAPPAGGSRIRSNYDEDGIRITGSWAFISSILGRLKELLQFENPSTKLRLVFRGIDANHHATPNKQAYVFYLNLQNRGSS